MEPRDEAESILKELGARLCKDTSDRDVWDWAYWPTLDMVESQDAQEDLKQTTVREYVVNDMIYRLGEQLPDMAKDVPTDAKEYSSARRKARAAIKLAAQLEAL